MERKSFFPKRNNTRQLHGETFSIVVEGYDLDRKPQVVLGKRMDTGEQVAVYLREVPYNRRGRHSRSEIADFAAPRKDRNHPGTVPGGIMLIQEGFKEGDNTYGARWIQALSHAPGEAEVFKTVIHMTPVKHGARTAEYPNGKPYALMTMLHDGDFSYVSDDMYAALKIVPPLRVENTQVLRERLIELLENDLGAGIRLSQNAGTPDEVADAQYVTRRRDEDPNVVVDRFLKASIEGELGEAIDNGAIAAEVITYSNMFAGPATLDIMMDNPVTQSRITQFNSQGEKDNGEQYPIPLYRPAIVAVRFTKPRDDGSRQVYFSAFEPVWDRQPVQGLVNAILHAKSELLAPEPKPLRAPRADSPTAPQNGAQGGAPSNYSPAGGDVGPESGFGSFDGGPVDEDLMGAAASVGGPDPSDIGDEIPPQQQSQPESTARRSRATARR